MSFRICCIMSYIRCMCFIGRIKSLQNSGHAHHSDTIECNPNYRNAMHKHFASFCVLTKVMHNFKDRTMNCSCLCVCFATMRLLLNVFHGVLQCFIIIALFISFNFPCFATNIYTVVPSISISVSKWCIREWV